MSSDYIGRIRSQIGSGLLLLPAVAALIRNDAGHLLLQEKSSGEGWSLPAGGIEPGETPEAAVEREVMEETGLLVSAATLMTILGGADYRYIYPSGDQVEYVIALYRCAVREQHPSSHDAETRSLRYFSPHAMPKLALPYPLKLLFSA